MSAPVLTSQLPRTHRLAAMSFGRAAGLPDITRKGDEAPMSRTVVVRYRTTPETAEENQRLVRQVYAELAATAPDGLRYVTLRLGDGVSFVHVALTEGDDVLSTLPAFREFQRRIGDRVEAPPAVEPAEIVGSYRIFN
jgi:hypothetical protein